MLRDCRGGWRKTRNITAKPRKQTSVLAWDSNTPRAHAPPERPPSSRRVGARVVGEGGGLEGSKREPMDEKVASRRWSRGGGVAARATRSSASLCMRERNLRVRARTDFIGAAHPRAVRTGDRVSRRPARIWSTSDPPNGYKDTTRERHDVRQIAPLSVFYGVFMFFRRSPRSPNTTRTRCPRFDDRRGHPRQRKGLRVP